jgi:hypothetical protein
MKLPQVLHILANFLFGLRTLGFFSPGALPEGILFFVFLGFGCDLIQKRIGEERDTDGLIW